MKLEPLRGCTHPELTERREGPGRTKPSQGPWLLAKGTLCPEELFVRGSTWSALPEPHLDLGMLWE